ncbi:TPA: Gfo/Idh/MocA family oxidoreductase [Candidatus Poribacteria bacterium]|nr:Gfo/Idh/MocA family oxidoreductase [Candidatus Poribacteria bacterium]
MNKIKIGAIGVGGIGGHQLRVASNNPDLFEIVAVCDNNVDIAKRVADEYKVDWHTDYKELCKRGDIDAVIVALPHYLYGEVVCYALECGLHVFKEKPFAKTLSDAKMMIDSAKKSGKQIFLAGQNKFSSAFIKAKEIADSGQIGDVFLTRGAIIYRWGGAIDGVWSWRGKEELSGGVAIIDAGWHILDMVHWLRGMPCAVYATTGTMKGAPKADYDVDDKAVLILEYPDGGIASIVSCFITLPGEMRVTLHGVNGCLDVNGGNLTFMIADKVQDVNIPKQEIDPITLQMRHFAESIQSGTESPVANTKRAYEVMQIVDAGYRSAKEKIRIEI